MHQPPSRFSGVFHFVSTAALLFVQVLANYAALYRTTPEALAAAYPALYRPDAASLSGTSSPKGMPGLTESPLGKEHAQG